VRCLSPTFWSVASVPLLVKLSSSSLSFYSCRPFIDLRPATHLLRVLGPNPYPHFLYRFLPAHTPPHRTVQSLALLTLRPGGDALRSLLPLLSSQRLSLGPVPFAMQFPALPILLSPLSVRVPTFSLFLLWTPSSDARACFFSFQQMIRSPYTPVCTPRSGRRRVVFGR